LGKSSGRPLLVDENFWLIYKQSGKSAKRFTKDLADTLDEQLSVKKSKDPLWRFRI